MAAPHSKQTRKRASPSSSRHRQPEAEPVPPGLGPARLEALLGEAGAQVRLAHGRLRVLFAPVLVGVVEAFCEYLGLRIADAALVKEGPDRVHLISIVRRGRGDGCRGL